MPKTLFLSICALVAGTLLWCCGDDAGTSGLDSGAIGGKDSGIVHDAGAGDDAGTGGDDRLHDGGSPTDAGFEDSGPRDSGSTDAGGGDVGRSDGGHADAGKDAGAEDGGSLDSGTVDTPRLDPSAGIAEVALYQAVKVALGESGGPVAQRNASIVAGRKALVRVFVDLSGSALHQVSCEVVVKRGAAKDVFSGTAAIPGASADTELSSTCNVTVPEASVTPDAAISARLVAAAAGPVPAGSAHPARFPADGSYLDLAARTTGGPISLVLVPMRYDTDGSGRLPDTGPQVLGAIERLFTSAYPADRVEITVRDPAPWDEDLTWGGSVDFSKLNQYIADLKEQDGAPSGSYYYGMIKPKETFGEYCSWACVAGQGWVVDDPADGAIRVASGVAFDVEKTAWTCAHETGHLHGRYHAPCSTIDSDQNYPYSGGKIGVWGWDRVSNLLYSPDTYTDFMGYCENQWVSDYTWDALLDRIVAVNALPPPEPGLKRPLRFLDIWPNGSYWWGRTVVFAAPPRGKTTGVGMFGEDGVSRGTFKAATLRHSHGGGATLLLDESALSASHLELRDVRGLPATRIRVETE